MAAALAREMEPAQHRAGVGSFVPPRPGAQVDEVPELLGRGERDHVGGVLGADFQDREVEVVRRDGLDQRLGVGRGEEQIDLLHAARRGNALPRRARIEERRAAVAGTHSYLPKRGRGAPEEHRAGTD